jgi:hypothetical protein
MLGGENYRLRQKLGGGSVWGGSKLMAQSGSNLLAIDTCSVIVLWKIEFQLYLPCVNSV